jgi:hypothetical protein
MFLLAVLLTIALVLEALPSAVVALVRAKVGLTRLDQLTRLGVLEGRNLRVVTLLGVLHALGTAAVLVGLDFPGVGVGGAAVEAAIFVWVLYRQLRAGDRGRALGAYLLFTGMALAVLVFDALRL